MVTGTIQREGSRVLRVSRFSPGWATPCRMSFLLALLTAILLFPAKSLAKEHPVPLDKNTDSATCVGCHEDKTKGKVVHSAIAAGCTSCHEIRVSKNVTRVKLITTTPVALCLGCHADKKAADIKGRVHPPAVRDCLACHDPHTSDNRNQLLKTTSGGKGENLCLSCHTIGLNVAEKGSRHAALDMGCDTCHTTHKVGDPEKSEFKYHLAKSTPALCLDCHDAKDEALQKAHNQQPFAIADCITCHDPHQSNRPKLLQAYAHQPFADGQCDVCHAAPKDSKIVLTQADSRQLCLTCHDDKGREIESAKVQHPGAQGDCITCHSPHAGKTPGHLQPDPVVACTNCHTDIGELHSKKVLHQPAFAQGCPTCHEAHGSENQHLLRVAKINALCLECHSPETNPKKLEGEHAVAIFDGKVKLPENYFTNVPVLPLQYGVGHPVDRHPVSDTMDFKAKAMRPMTCLTCHQPHAGNQTAMLVKDQEPNMAFCKTCHTEGTIQMQAPVATGR